MTHERQQELNLKRPEGSKICSLCGKPFYIEAGVRWTYKKTTTAGSFIYCSHKCSRAADMIKKPKKARAISADKQKLLTELIEALSDRITAAEYEEIMEPAKRAAKRVDKHERELAEWYRKYGVRGW